MIIHHESCLARSGYKTTSPGDCRGATLCSEVWSSGWVDDNHCLQQSTVLLPICDADVVLGLLQPKWLGVGRLGGPDWHWAWGTRVKMITWEWNMERVANKSWVAGHLPCTDIGIIALHKYYVHFFLIEDDVS